MGAAPSDLSSKHVVVVGGSFAGVHAAKEAAKAGFRVTMLVQQGVIT